VREQGKTTAVDEGAIREQAQQAAERLARQAGIRP